MSVLARFVAAAALTVTAGTVLVTPAGAAAVAPGCSTTTSVTSTTTISPTVTTTTTVANPSQSITVPISPTESYTSSVFPPRLRNADQPAIVAGDPCTTTSTTTSTTTAPITTSTSSSTASPSPSPTPTAPTLKLSGVPASAHPGDSFAVTITGLSPGGHFTVEMHSVVVVLGDGDADNAGRAVVNVTVPTDISTGLHQVVVLGENPPESATAAIVIIADPTTSSSENDTTTTSSDEPVAVLSNTGAPAATPMLVLVGSGCIVLGLACLFLVRRRRNEPGEHV